ncbi:MAG: carboxypeptidase regulatory-like domain-containing protein [Planctomycetes bacterium]|nr:carboxypeptidase regulatory-like domain-containing protein [Planctomycetota bacterium]
MERPPSGPSRCLAALFLVCLAAAAPDLRAQHADDGPGTLEGTVRDENGAPLAGAAVGVFAGGSELDVPALLKAPDAVSGADGHYAIDASGKGAWPSVVVAMRDRQACAIRVRGWTDGQPLVLEDALLVPGVQLIGRVRGPDGAGLAGAHIGVEGALRTQSSGAIAVRSGAFANTRGIFVVPGVPRSGLTVTIRCPGYVGCTMLTAQESPLDVTLQPAAVVRGRVVGADGQPIADASVRIAAVASPPMTACRTDADGRFAIDVPPDVLLRLKVSAHGRSFASALLRGAHDDVAVTEVVGDGDGEAARSVKLLVRDAASGETLPNVHVSKLMFGADRPVIALFHRHDPGADFTGEAQVPLDNNTNALLVEAPGHGFELVDVVAGDEPQVVALGSEAVVTGVVTDAETGAPVAGAHVRALPKGNSSGSGGVLDGILPRSDANGRYRIEGLRPGEYSVQVHVADRLASQPEAIDLTAQREVSLDLVVPARVWLDVVVEGELAPGPSPQLRSDGLRSQGGGNGFFQHHITAPPPRTVREAGTVHLGPVGGSSGELLVWVPSRLRCDAGSSLAVPVGGEAPKIDLASLRSVLVTGRVEADDLPLAQVAVQAERVDDGARRRAGQPARAGLEAGGQFALDLLPGRYRLSLLDLESNLVFHVEADELEVGAAGPSPVLRPALHRLTVHLEADPADGELVLQTLRVEAAAIDVDQGRNATAVVSGAVTMVPGRRTVRLLLPKGSATIAASRAFGVLARVAASYRYETVAEQKVEIERAETELTLRVPAPPSDEELRKEHG